MSRLQKKKPFSDKKKSRGTKSEVKPDSAVKPSGLTSPKANAASSLKSKKDTDLTEKKAGEANFFQKAIKFFREVKIELKKVTWPTRKQTTGTTIVVIIFVFVIAVFLGLFDYSLSRLVQVVLT
jgi:preprotein translocase subunit SecE